MEAETFARSESPSHRKGQTNYQRWLYKAKRLICNELFVTFCICILCRSAIGPKKNHNSETCKMYKCQFTNETNTAGYNALQLAASRGKLGHVRFLVALGVNFGVDTNGFSSLHVAAGAGREEVVSFLLQHVDDIDEKVIGNGPSSLWIASDCGHLDVVKLLVEKGASMDGDKLFFSPLHAAAIQGHVRVVKFLTDHVQDVDVLNNRGDTALFLASLKGHLDVVTVLVENGAQVTADRFGSSALHLAAYGGHVRVVDVLLKHSKRVNAMTDNGKTALYLASSNGQLEVVKLLVNNGAAMFSDKEGNSPLLAAALGGHVKVVSFLLQRVEDINVVNSRGLTALSVASYFGHIDVVKLLVENGATIVGGKEGYSPLHAAAYQGHARVLSYLLQHVEDVNVLNNRGETTYFLAKLKGHT